MERKAKAKIESDTPWKNILDLHFEDCIKFFFPQAHQDIDWGRGFEYLDKEFQKIIRDAEVGSRLADKLVKVWTKQNREVWVLTHIEVQGKKEKHFAERMFIYYYRIYDRYKSKIVSLAILTDENPKWRPVGFNSEMWNCRLAFDYPVVKLSDYKEKWSYLESSDNPFAAVVMAHLIAQDTRKEPDDSRLASKLAITRRLYNKGYNRESIVNLYLFIDWIIKLPKELEQQFREEIHQFERKSKMQYVSSIERLAKEEGIEQGIQKGIQQGVKQGVKQGQEKLRNLLLESSKHLEFKFGKKGLELLPIVLRLKSARELNTFQKRLNEAETAGELKKLYKVC